MASRRGDSGSTEWFGVTGSNVTATEFPNETEVIAMVPGPTPTMTNNPIVELPVGTLLRTFGAIAVFDDSGGGGSSFDHPFAALHHDEAVQDSDGALNFTTLDLADGDNLGFEGLIWLGSCILWRSIGTSGEPNIADARRGCQIKTDSKAKRKLRSNDIIALDLANLVSPTATLNWSYHFRFLIKYA